MVNRLGLKTPVAAGMRLLAAGIAVLSLVRPDGTFADRRVAGHSGSQSLPPSSRPPLPAALLV